MEKPQKPVKAAKDAEDAEDTKDASDAKAAKDKKPQKPQKPQKQAKHGDSGPARAAGEKPAANAKPAAKADSSTTVSGAPGASATSTSITVTTSASPASPTSPGAKPKPKIYVDNPVVCQGSPHPFVSYSIHLQHGGKKLVLPRRMKDIKALHKNLEAECAVLNLPPLPEDKWWFFGGNTRGFVTRRCDQLNTYFRRLYKLPMLQKSKVWKEFVRMEVTYTKSSMTLK